MEMILPASPYVKMSELAEMWNVSTDTVRRWFQNAGIAPARRGRYAVNDVVRFAQTHGKATLSMRESFEMSVLRKENEYLKDQLETMNNKLKQIARLSVSV